MGKSTLAFNLAGALSDRGKVVLVDEDTRIQSCLTWAGLASVPFRVLSPEQTRQGVQQADFLLVDSEGRPSRDDLAEMVGSFDRVLIPCGVSRLEIGSTLALWRALKDPGGVVRVVITKAPPVGRVGQDARDALRAAGVPCLDAVVRRYAAHERAAEVGGVVRDVRDDRAGEAWADVQAVAAEVVK